jgi:hypothetical protein
VFLFLKFVRDLNQPALKLRLEIKKPGQGPGFHIVQDLLNQMKSQGTKLKSPFGRLDLKYVCVSFSMAQIYTREFFICNYVGSKS